VEGCSLVAGSPNRAACPLLAAHLTTAAAFSILEAEQLSLDWSLGVESSCHEELTVIPVTVLLHPSVNISLTQVSLWQSSLIKKKKKFSSHIIKFR
jgi:hypothetical protein